MCICVGTKSLTEQDRTRNTKRKRVSRLGPSPRGPLSSSFQYPASCSKGSENSKFKPDHFVFMKITFIKYKNKNIMHIIKQFIILTYNF